MEQPAPSPDTPPATLRPQGAASIGDAAIRALIVVAVAGVVTIGFIGAWSYGKVGESLRELRGSNLTALLEAYTGVLQLWIDEKKLDAERWAGVPDVQQAAATLARLATRGVAPAISCDSGAHAALLAQIAPFAAQEQTVTFNLISPDGTILASQQPGECGRRIASADFMERIAPVFGGRTVFVRPWLESERIGAAGEGATTLLVWIETPVRGEGGEVIGSLGFGRLAGDRFGKLLLGAGGDTTREAYTFGPSGNMLSQSRFAPQLLEAGRIEALGREVGMPVREPQGEPTRLALSALDGLRSGGAEGAQGMLLEPYPNYRGAEVIGAWRWLGGKEMAVAVEVEAAEAYAPQRYVQTAFGVLFAFLLASLLAAAGLTLWATHMQMREGRRVGQYTIERELGEGGMSNVYLARHSQLKRPTAVKVLKAHLASDEVVTRFEREVRLCSELSHPNTIEIYDYGRTREGAFFYAMEYLRGLTLEELVGQEGAMPAWRAVYLLRQACASLREAHSHGLVHRDVKPHNLMLCARGGEHDVLKVLDFGLVKEVRESHTRDITQYARVLGTPLYMAPERLRDPADADARADIYALAAVAHFILTGKKLFESQTDHDLVYQVLNAPAPSLADHGARDVPDELEDLLARCLAKPREARPASIDEVDAVLARIAIAHPWREGEARAWWEAHAALLADVEPYVQPLMDASTLRFLPGSSHVAPSRATSSRSS
jgi:serine/threonine-protein kinase